MADKKISELNALAAADAADEMAIVDDDVAETKKITFANLTSPFATSGAVASHIATTAIHLTASQAVINNTASAATMAAHAATTAIHLTASQAVITNTASRATINSAVTINTASRATINTSYTSHKADSTIHYTSGAIWTAVNINTASRATINTAVIKNTASSATMATHAGTSTIHLIASAAVISHMADSSNPHGTLLTQTNTSGAIISVTGDTTASLAAVVQNIVFGTDATPPTASNYNQGTIYVQYTA